jgi:crossover junction endodeoxyribonuclease RuvC
MIRVLALDLSLTGTGYALAGGANGVLKNDKRGMARLDWIEQSIMGLARMQRTQLVVIESYSFNSEMSRAHALGELGGVIRLAFYRAGIPYVDVPPASLKLFACNAGNAKKDQVLAAAREQLGYTGRSNDEADALWLREMALAHYHPEPNAFTLEVQRGKKVRTLAAARSEAIAAVEWPGFVDVDATLFSSSRNRPVAVPVSTLFDKEA